MSMSTKMRQFHRRLSIAFTIFVLANFAVQALNQPAIGFWVGALTLVPLFLLLFTGLYLFALPYSIKWRAAKRVSA